VAFFDNGHPLFHIYEWEEIRHIVERVYRPRDSATVDKVILGELCALAAVGSHYDGQNVDVPIMENLYNTACAYLGDCIEAYFFRGMRVILCLSMYSLITKRWSARESVASGLRLARQSREEGMPADMWIPYRRVYRSLVFMECWLSASVGKQPELDLEEVDFTQQRIVEAEPTIENEIQRLLSNVGLILAGVARDVSTTAPVLFAVVHRHLAVLYDWEGTLPPPMRVQALVREDSNVYDERHRRALIVVHTMALGAKMLLVKRLMVDMANCRRLKRWTLDGNPEQGRQLQQQCVDAAEQCVRLLEMQSSARQTFQRCWLSV
jgi:hypothetical protein